MKKYIYFLVLIASLSLAFNACSVTISPNIPSGTSSGIGTPSTTQTQLGVRTKTSGCMAQGGLPDSACTPGAIFTNATQQEICTYGYTRSVRNVPFSEKDRVENYLHDQVCSGAMSMKEAQTEIATNWLAVYHRMTTQY